MAPVTTIHKVKYLHPLHMAKEKVLSCAADASTEIQGACVPVALEGHRNRSPVSTSVFQGRDAKVDRTICCERLMRPLLW